METYYDRKDEAQKEAKGTVRRLPYAAEGEVAHYDFIANPALITEVLEDFKPYAEWHGIQKFYRLLRYLNGPRSVFETTDCLFRGPGPNGTPEMGDKAPYQVHGRLMLIYRDHIDNLSQTATHALHASIHEELRAIRPNWPMGCIGTAFYWAWFTSLSPVPSEAVTGKELVLRFWAWGHDDAECFENFGTLMQGIGVSLCRVQKRYEHWVSIGRPTNPEDGLYRGWRQRAAEWAATKERIRELHLFGSRAKGEFNEESDTDIAYFLTGDESGEKLAYSICECRGWEAELAAKLNTKVDLQFSDNEEGLKVWDWVREHGQLIYRKPGCMPLE